MGVRITPYLTVDYICGTSVLLLGCGFTGKAESAVVYARLCVNWNGEQPDVKGTTLKLDDMEFHTKQKYH